MKEQGIKRQVVTYFFCFCWECRLKANSELTGSGQKSLGSKLRKKAGFFHLKKTVKTAIINQQGSLNGTHFGGINNTHVTHVDNFEGFPL